VTAATAPGPGLQRGTTRTRSAIAADVAFAGALFAGTLLGVVALGVLLYTVYDTGWSRFAADPVAFVREFPSRVPGRAGIHAALIGSIYLMGLTAVMTVPIGVGAATYLEEFAGRNRWTRLIEANVANLAGVPSVVFGLLGYGAFVRLFDLGPSLLAGALTLSVMSMPVVIIAARESIRAVPESVRLGALALGATRWQATRSHVLPAALPGTLTGAILALSRAIGETAPLLVVGAAVSIYNTPRGVHDPFSALPMLIFSWTGRPQPEWADAAAAAIIVLLALLLAMNAVAIFVRNRFSVRW
jgi:phosphate transport system permease protein